MKRTALWDTVRRSLHWHRRSIAAAAAVICVVATITALRPDAGETVVVMAAARAFPGGTVLTEADLVPLRLPPAAAPEGAAVSVADVAGRALAGPVTRGSPLTTASVASGQELAREGFVVIALPLADDALTSLLQGGSRIDILGPTRGGAGVLARDVRVVAPPAAQPDGLGGGLVGQDPVALVEVTPEVAVELAAAAVGGGVAIALR